MNLVMNCVDIGSRDRIKDFENIDICFILFLLMSVLY